jgi:hypothetical protein
MTILSANGSTDAVNLDGVHRTFAFQTVITGTPTSFTLTYEGSLNGTNWYTLGTTTSTAGEGTFVVDKPAQFVRATLSALTGGTSPTISPYVGACA